MCEGDDDGGKLDGFLILKVNRKKSGSLTANLDGTLNFSLQICAAVCANC